MPGRGTVGDRNGRDVLKVESAGALALVIGLVALLAFGGATTSAQHQVLGTPTFTPTFTPTLSPTLTPTATQTLAPTETPVPTQTPAPTKTPMPAQTPTPSPTLSPTALPAQTAGDWSHLWLESPIGPGAEGDRYPGTYFPYGATGGGRYHLHHGVDYMNPAGTRVLAAAAGNVIVAGHDLEVVYGAKPDFYGNLVIQELDQSFQSETVYLLYAHLSEVIAGVGEHLEPGDPVGLVGMTGVAIGNHLHLEVRLGSNDYESTRNPVLWLHPEPGQGVIAGLFADSDHNPVPEAPITFFRADEPDKWWRQVQTYAIVDTKNPGISLGIDDHLGENFALGYVPAGDYLVKAAIEGKSYVEPVTVRPDEISFVLITAKE